ncbi:MAG TPA: MaoC family dehydratase [Trebonia sp.]|jgi:acyl dehydratase|nr:MaoC family dehydratase [Trebonia sp.]
MTFPWAAAPQEPTRTLSEADFAVPPDDRYFEDYKEGAVYEYGYATVDETELVAFARRFDPQLMHVDAQWAATGPFGGLIASGWHTGGIFMRLFADHYLSRVASLASPGLDELRWSAPARPGDVLRLRVTTEQTRLSRSKPDRGLVHTYSELINGDDTVVLSVRAANFIGRRPA